jgi:multidrug efflux system membrane fusion protein
VTGYLVQMPFKEGSEVKKGDLLFVIDPRPYQAQFDQAKAQVVLNQASLELAKSTLARYEALDKSTPGAVSKQALDQYQAAVVEADARVEAQIKSLEVYRLNKEFTQIESPIDGQVSRYYLTLGNLVNQDQTLLTTIVSLDPMYAYFDMDERTLLNIRKALAEGRIARYADGESIPLLMGLENEDGFPHQGTINFVNNQVNSTTGSITLRGVFANSTPVSLAGAAADSAGTPKTRQPAAAARSAGTPKTPNPAVATGPAKTSRPLPRLLSPGMFLRVRLPIGQAHSAVLIIDRAVQSDQGLKYVYVVDAQNKVQYRRVTTGALQEDGLRVIDGVKPEDWVVVGALQQVRPRMEIKPEQGPMPSLRKQAEGTGQE